MGTWGTTTWARCMRACTAWAQEQLLAFARVMSGGRLDGGRETAGEGLAGKVGSGCTSLEPLPAQAIPSLDELDDEQVADLVASYNFGGGEGPEGRGEDGKPKSRKQVGGPGADGRCLERGWWG